MQNPQTDLPFGIIGTLGITSVLYVGVSIVLTGMVPYYNIDTSAPLSTAFAKIGILWAAILISFLSLTTLTGNILVSIIGQPRIFYQMAVDGLLFSCFKRVNKKGVPLISTIISALLAVVLSCILSLDSLTNMISAGTLGSYMVVCMGVIHWRYQTPLGQDPGYYSRIRNKSIETLCAFVVINRSLFLWVYILFCVGLSLSIRLQFSLVSMLIYAIGMVIIYILFQLLRPADLNAPYITPFVPLLPMLGMFFNIFLMIGLPFDSLIRLGVWSGIGLLFYIFYGIHFSKGRDEEISINEV